MNVKVKYVIGEELGTFSEQEAVCRIAYEIRSSITPDAIVPFIGGDIDTKMRVLEHCLKHSGKYFQIECAECGHDVGFRDLLSKCPNTIFDVIEYIITVMPKDNGNSYWLLSIHGSVAYGETTVPVILNYVCNTNEYLKIIYSTFFMPDHIVARGILICTRALLDTHFVSSICETVAYKISNFTKDFTGECKEIFETLLTTSDKIIL